MRAYPPPGAGAGERAEEQTLLTSTLLGLMADVRHILEALHDLQTRMERLESRMAGRVPPQSDWEDLASDAEFTPLHPEVASDLRSAERSLIQAALRQCGGNRRKTAEQLGISERTLYRKLKEYDLE